MCNFLSSPVFPLLSYVSFERTFCVLTSATVSVCFLLVCSVCEYGSSGLAVSAYQVIG